MLLHKFERSCKGACCIQAAGNLEVGRAICRQTFDWEHDGFGLEASQCLDGPASIDYVAWRGVQRAEFDVVLFCAECEGVRYVIVANLLVRDQKPPSYRYMLNADFFMTRCRHGVCVSLHACDHAVFKRIELGDVRIYLLRFGHSGDSAPAFIGLSVASAIAM